MKRRLVYLIISCICLIVTSCSREVTIGGTAEKTKALSLYSFSDGEITLLQSVSVDKGSGAFEFLLEIPYDGLYLLGSNEQALFPLYLKGGDKINAEFRNNRLSLVGEMSAENSALFKWENVANEVKIDSFLYKYLPGENGAGYAEFFEELEALVAHKGLMLKELEGKRDEFYTLLADKIDADVKFYALNYLRSFGMEIPDTLTLPAFYNTISPDKTFQNPDIIRLPYAGKMLDTYIWYLSNCKSVAGDMEKKWPFELLEEKTLQQEYLLLAASQMKYYDEYAELMQMCGDGFFTGAYKRRIEAVGKALTWSEPGVEAFDFKGVAPDSSVISLSDYKGKVVVVDVWATWCEPCRRMMPLFHDMQKEFVGKNVEFLSVCVGVWVEMDRWIELSKEFHIEKNNFFIEGWSSEFVKNYRISGVPRYMIFDEHGRIVTVNAPNPTTDKLKKLILETLK